MHIYPNIFLRQLLVPLVILPSYHVPQNLRDLFAKYVFSKFTTSYATSCFTTKSEILSKNFRIYSNLEQKIEIYTNVPPPKYIFHYHIFLYLMAHHLTLKLDGNMLLLGFNTRSGWRSGMLLIHHHIFVIVSPTHIFSFLAKSLFPISQFPSHSPKT